MEDIELGGAPIKILKTEKEADKHLSDEGPTMIIYYAKWCGHCRGSYESWKQLARNVKGKAQICMIESDNYPKVTSFPTIKIVKKGKAADYEGAREVEDMKSALLSAGGRRRSRRLRRRVRKTHRALR
jgi:thioredoxin-like negative regulator of GroEL